MSCGITDSSRYIMGESYLTNIGAATEFTAGASFWNRYGRTLYNASVGQVSYNATAGNGTARPKPVLRTTGQSRIENSQINWALGFFGTSFQTTPQPSLQAFGNGSLFDVVIIPEGGTENNTLAAYGESPHHGGFNLRYVLTTRQTPALTMTLPQCLS